MCEKILRITFYVYNDVHRMADSTGHPGVRSLGALFNFFVKDALEYKVADACPVGSFESNPEIYFWEKNPQNRN